MMTVGRHTSERRHLEVAADVALEPLELPLQLALRPGDIIQVRGGQGQGRAMAQTLQNALEADPQ